MRAKRLDSSSELNLLPVMNLITLLIPFLMMAAQFVSLAVIDVTLPGPPPDEADPTGLLDLTVHITPNGFFVLGADDQLREGLPIPCVVAGCPSVDDYNVNHLAAVLSGVKDRWPLETVLVLVPDPLVPFEVMVRAMDAARLDPDQGASRPLFPSIVIGAGGA